MTLQRAKCQAFSPWSAGSPESQSLMVILLLDLWPDVQWLNDTIETVSVTKAGFVKTGCLQQRELITNRYQA